MLLCFLAFSYHLSLSKIFDLSLSNFFIFLCIWFIGFILFQEKKGEKKRKEKEKKKKRKRKLKERLCLLLGHFTSEKEGAKSSLSHIESQAQWDGFRVFTAQMQ